MRYLYIRQIFQIQMEYCLQSMYNYGRSGRVNCISLIFHTPWISPSTSSKKFKEYCCESETPIYKLRLPYIPLNNINIKNKSVCTLVANISFFDYILYLFLQFQNKIFNCFHSFFSDFLILMRK